MPSTLDYGSDAVRRGHPVSVILGISSIVLLSGYCFMRYGLGDEFWFLNALAALSLIPLAGIVAVIGVIAGYRRLRSRSHFRSNLTGLFLNCIAILLMMVLIKLELK